MSLLSPTAGGASALPSGAAAWLGVGARVALCLLSLAFFMTSVMLYRRAARGGLCAGGGRGDDWASQAPPDRSSGYGSPVRMYHVKFEALAAKGDVAGSAEPAAADMVRLGGNGAGELISDVERGRVRTLVVDDSAYRVWVPAEDAERRGTDRRWLWYSRLGPDVHAQLSQPPRPAMGEAADEGEAPELPAMGFGGTALSTGRGLTVGASAAVLGY